MDGMALDGDGGGLCLTGLVGCGVVGSSDWYVGTCGRWCVVVVVVVPVIGVFACLGTRGVTVSALAIASTCATSWSIVPSNVMIRA